MRERIRDMSVHSKVVLCIIVAAVLLFLYVLFWFLNYTRVYGYLLKQDVNFRTTYDGECYICGVSKPGFLRYKGNLSIVDSENNDMIIWIDIFGNIEKAYDIPIKNTETETVYGEFIFCNDDYKAYNGTLQNDIDKNIDIIKKLNNTCNHIWNFDFQF